MFLVIIQNLFFFTNCSSNSRIQISADGGYSNIVIKFDNDVSQHHCSLYIKYLTVGNQIFFGLKHGAHLRRAVCCKINVMLAHKAVKLYSGEKLDQWKIENAYC